MNIITPITQPEKLKPNYASWNDLSGLSWIFFDDYLEDRSLEKYEVTTK